MISSRNRYEGPSTRTMLRAVVVAIGAAITLYVIYLLRQPLSWIFVAGFIAVALTGPVTVLSRRMPRGLAIAAVYVMLVALPIAVFALIAPPLLAEATVLVENVPGYVEDLSAFVQGNATLRRLDADYQILENLQQRATELPAQLGDAAGTLANVGLGLVNSIFALVTVLFLSVFLVASGPGWVRAWLHLQPEERAERFDRTMRAMAGAVGGYVAGALLQATVAGVLTFLVLEILGVPFALPLAVLVMLFDLIPLVGATIGALLVGIVTLFFDFPTTTIIWTIWSIVYQQVENNIIQPQIQRRAVAVHPFVVLVAVLFGSALFGILGALLAIPVAASLQIAVKEWWAWRRVSHQQTAAAIAGSTTTTPTGTGTAPPAVAPRTVPDPD